MSLKSKTEFESYMYIYLAKIPSWINIFTTTNILAGHTCYTRVSYKTFSGENFMWHNVSHVNITLLGIILTLNWLIDTNSSCTTVDSNLPRFMRIAIKGPKLFYYFFKYDFWSNWGDFKKCRGELWPGRGYHLASLPLYETLYNANKWASRTKIFIQKNFATYSIW